MDNGAGSYRRFLDGEDEGMVDLIKDYKDGLILNAARAAAEAVLDEDPTLTSSQNQMLRSELRKEKYQIKDYSKIS